MSFQNFRLDGISVQPVQTPSYSTPAPAPTSNLQDGGATRGTQRGPYGSGDMDDGYTLVFENLEAFQTWRVKEEEEKIIEFVKGDTHGSKAVPPRFKDHVKLVCARHSRSGRKKYVKKYPERVRKVPSRKVWPMPFFLCFLRIHSHFCVQLEGIGCPASISYKTYFDTPEVRVCCMCRSVIWPPHIFNFLLRAELLGCVADMSQHSHEIGPANLLFTSRGRRQAASKSALTTSHPATPTPTPNTGQSQPAGPGIAQSNAQGGQVTTHMQAQPNLPLAFSTPYPHFPSMTMPLPQGLGGVMPFPPPALPVSAAQVGPAGERGRMERERWERMDVLYQSIRHNANQFEYPAPSVAALESVLVRMYFESPISGPQHPQPHPAAFPATSIPPPHLSQPQQPENNAVDHADMSDGASESDDDDEDEDEE